MKEEIINLSKKLNIDIIGFTKLENYTELEKKYPILLFSEKSEKSLVRF